MKTRHLGIALLLAVGSVTAIGTLVPHDVRSQSAPLQPRQLRVVWTEDPAHRALVSWTTSEAGEDHVVHFDTIARGGALADYQTSIEVTDTGAYDDAGPFFHHARLTDLEPDTEYHFVVETDGNASPELYFRTAPDDRDATFKLLYGGDSRTGREERQRMNRLIAETHDADPEILALVHGGDYINWANTWWQWSNWLDDHELTFGEDGRVLPIIPAKGNHEGRGVVYNKVFGNPGGSAQTNWFYTSFGGLSLINLDTEDSFAGDQRDWLEERLQQGRSSKWLVVNYHRPAFPAVKTPSGAREHWVPLFEEYGVDLVCESDGHTLKRTPPILGERVDYAGVTYVGEGGLGVPQRTPVTDRWYLQAPGMAASAHHVQLLSFEGDVLRYQAMLQDGSVADEITVLGFADRQGHRITATMAQARSSDRVEVTLSRPFDEGTALDPSSYDLEPTVDVEEVVVGAEVSSVLRLVNEAGFTELDDDVRLDRRAAANILDVRAGDDGELGTDDDRRIESWDELDAISWVGPRAFSKLSEYALQRYGNPRNAVTLHTGALEAEQTYRLAVSDVADMEGTAVADGTTVSFTYTSDLGPADSIGPDDSDDASAAGCTTAPGRGAPSGLWLALILGLIGVRRWRSTTSEPL